MAPSLSKLAAKLDTNPKYYIIFSSAAAMFWLHSVLNRNKKRYTTQNKHIVVGIPDNTSSTKRVQVNAEFIRSLRKILKILIPRYFSKEMGYVVLVAFSLFLRSFFDIWMINNATLIEGSIISQNVKGFTRNIGNFFLAMPATSLVNNILKFSLQELKLTFRIRLTKYLYDRYLSGFTYYKMNNLDNRISNADQLLTQDVEKFCDSLVDLYSNISKPLLDIVIYLQKLTEAIGVQAPGLMIIYLISSGSILTRLRGPIARLTATEQKLEGEFRYVNSRLITNCEEIAFYKGNVRENLNLTVSFQKLIGHLRRMIDFKFNMGFVDNIIARYFALCVGFCVIAISFFDPSSRYKNTGHQYRMEEYYKTGRMLVKLGEAIGRLVLAGRELTRLSGFTHRVQELMTVLSDINRGHYQRSVVGERNGGSFINLNSRGKVLTTDNVIKFEKVPLITPNGDVLVSELNFEVKSGMNVLVCGPNGCGKSSLFRILGELWPVFGGTVTKPSAGKLFYIPQRPYMTLGTLRDQVIYPDSKENMGEKEFSDIDLLDLLERVQLSYILEREGGWDAVADWMDVLSGGEKQRIAMARVFYHKPQFAILDECTSAVSVDVEGEIYRYCRAVGITLFTVSHRKSLWKHHEYYLHMDGRGSFEYKPIDEGTIEFGS